MLLRNMLLMIYSEMSILSHMLYPSKRVCYQDWWFEDQSDSDEDWVVDRMSPSWSTQSHQPAEVQLIVAKILQSQDKSDIYRVSHNYSIMRHPVFMKEKYQQLMLSFHRPLILHCWWKQNKHVGPLQLACLASQTRIHSHNIWSQFSVSWNSHLLLL